MSARSAIEWTQVTWNPVTGCTKISHGCKHCYAERMAKRLQAIGVEKYRTGFSISTHPATLGEPLTWRKPRVVFVNSMSDLFHQSVPTDFVESVFAVMNRASRHTFQILTKRPARVARLEKRLRWTPNIWLGTSIESDRWLGRLAALRQTGARTRFLSLEPLLGPLSNLDLDGVDWVIVGGESGPGARPMREDWVRKSATIAWIRKSPSSSSNGAGCSRSGPVAYSITGRGIKRPSRCGRDARVPRKGADVPRSLVSRWNP